MGLISWQGGYCSTGPASAAGVKLTETGYVAVDEHLAATAAGVWAMGECAGSPQFTHAAFDEFRVVHDTLTGGSRTTSDRLVPYCMYTGPELARVGYGRICSKQ
jgi:pyruvate/2-oxoglutarate dehydrogenase complex dihydrolipoamide dehydrogenase (E3) component